jgi:hypothetical protein
MAKKRLTLTLISLALLILAGSTLLAQDSRARYPQVAVRQQNSSSVVHPMQKEPANCKKLFGNLGPKDDAYDANNGYFVSGINNAFNAEKQDLAVPFTLKADSTVVQVKLPLQYYGFGFNGATVAIYSDASGLPGTALPGSSKDPKNFQDFGAGCCDLAVVWYQNGLQLKKGKQYWIVGTTDKKSMDSINTWDFVWNDAAGTFAFQQDDGGWILLTQSDGYAPPAVGLYGTTP